MGEARDRRRIVRGGLLPPLTIFLALLTACSDNESRESTPSAVSAPNSNTAFLDKHWDRPLPTQGSPPAGYSPSEASLDPVSCGSCHVDQYRDWRTSLHAKAMGPGVLGQLVEMPAEARSDHQDCIRCHAPLAEQADSLATAIAAGQGGGKAGGGLHTQGLVCAACHVRGHERFGPPRRDGSAPGPAERGSLPHGGWTASAAFGDSRFCAACHQFEPDGYALEGKLLENTVEEWKASRFAVEGRTCQSCHMPERRHLWRGVHDPEMMRMAVTVDPRPPRLEEGAIRAALRIVNSGAGHYFPTYVTPRVVAEIFQEDAGGRPIEGTLMEHSIQRQVTPDLSREIADTRLAPGAEAVLAYDRQREPGAVRLVYRLRAEPDHFYTGFYESVLAGADEGPGTDMIRMALALSRASHFVFHETRLPLDAP